MENNLDKLFKSKLGGMEPDFHPAAWERMEGLLEESDMTAVREAKPKKSRRKYLILLLLGLLFSAIGYYSVNSIDTNDIGSALEQSESSEPLQSNESNLQTTSTINTISTEKINENTSIKSEGNSLEYNSNQASIVSSLGEAKANTISNSSEVKRESKAEIVSDERVSSNITELGAIFTNQDSRQDFEKEEVKEESTQAEKKDVILANTIKEAIREEGREVKKEETISVSDEISQGLKNEEESRSNESEPSSLSSPLVVAGLDVLETRAGHLFKTKDLVSPQNKIIKPSLFVAGIQASIRPASGLSYSMGPYLNLSMGNGFGLSTSMQFDMQNFDGGPELSVYDKVYSFGSKLKERTFALSNQKSIRVPLTLRKAFPFFGVSAGLIYNRVLTSGGDLGDTGETGSTEFIQVENELLRESTISMQIGASFSISRYLDLELGMEYRPKVFHDDVSVSNNVNKYYPSFGVRYKLFKF